MTDRLRDQLQSALGPGYSLERELGGGGMSHVFARLSPDGSRIALVMRENGYPSLSVYDVARGTLTTISRREATTQSPVWTPNGDALFYAVEEPVYQVYRRASDAAEPEARVLASRDDKFPTSMSPDGRTLLFADIAFATDTGGTYRIARVATDGASSPEDVIQRPVGQTAADRQHVVVIVNWLQTLSERLGVAAP